MTSITNAKIKAFRNKVKDLLDQELNIRAEMKQLYNVLVIESGDDKITLRHVQQAYFQIQKHRINKLLEDQLEFHPFFTINPFIAEDLFTEEDGDDELL